MIDPVDRAVRAIARRHASALVWLQFGVSHLVLFGGVGLLTLYEPISIGRFWVLTVVSQALVGVDNIVSIKLTRRLWAPFRRWERGERDRATTIAAWLALATLPIEYLRTARRYFLLSYLPLMAFFTWELKLPWYGFFVLAVVGSVVLAYGLILRYFMMEVVVRPVLEPVAEALPADFSIAAPSLPLPYRLLAVAPVINVITGVVVAGLVDHRHHASLSDLGLPGWWPSPSRSQSRWSSPSWSSAPWSPRCAICGAPPSASAWATSARGFPWWPPTRRACWPSRSTP